MAGACAVAVSTPAAPPEIILHHLAPRRRSSFSRVSCSGKPRATGLAAAARNSGRARLSRRDPGEAAPDAGVGKIPKDDSSYLLKLSLGSVGGAAAIKYGSILLPDITRPNIVQALLIVSLPVAASVFLLLKASSADD
ncbi:hypothetical protein ACP4OV_000463 [Aristida adscensionis]